MGELLPELVPLKQNMPREEGREGLVNHWAGCKAGFRQKCPADDTKSEQLEVNFYM